MNDWRQLLRQARKPSKITQARLGELAGLSVETIRGYENGRRQPTRRHLVDVLDALGLPQSDANTILHGAGFVGRDTLFPPGTFPSYFFSAAELQTHVEGVPWPEFVLNNNSEIVAANSAAQALWAVDLKREQGRRSPAQMNLLCVASESRFSERIANWDECVATLISVFKGKPQGSESIDHPGQYFQEVLGQFIENDPAFLPRLLSIWTATPPRTAKVRWHYKVTWADPELGEMRFNAIVSTASEPDGLGFNDWIPLEGATWSKLGTIIERYKESRGRHA